MPYLDKEKQKEHQRLWMARRRADYLRDKSCVGCGSISNLEIDHIDPTQKVTNRIWSWSDERRAVELAKCQVLCGECHKKKTILAREPPKCGTHSSYSSMKKSCRCEKCKSAHAKYEQGRRKIRADILQLAESRR